MEKNCENCGTSFDAKRSDKKYCTHRCKYEAFEKAKKNKPLGETPLFDQTVSPTVEKPKPEEPNLSKINPLFKKEREITLPGGLDATAGFIIEMQKMDNRELRDTVKEQFNEIKTLTKEKADLEKQLTEARNEASRKPTALEGIASTFTMDHVMELFRDAPKKIREVRDLIANAPAPQQLGEGPQQPSSPYAVWLGSKPEDVQKSFGQLMDTLMKFKSDPQLKYAIDQMVRGQVMRAVS